MNKKRFHYIPQDMKLAECFASYSSADCIVCESNQIRSILEAQFYEEDLLVERPKIISFEEFFSSIFLTDKVVLKGIHRIFSLYQILEREDKKRWNIKNYFDFVDIANDFFHFYEECIGVRKNIEEKILPWQKEKFLFFESMKKRFDEKLEKENSIPKDWLYQKENYNPLFVKKFSNILFFDIVVFPTVFLEILPFLEEEVSLEFLLQMHQEDFDEKKLRLHSYTVCPFLGNVTTYQVGSNWEETLFLLSEKEKQYLRIYASQMETKNYHQLFPHSFVDLHQNIFNKTKLYQFMELQIELLRKQEDPRKKELPLEAILYAAQRLSIQEYYEFTKQDILFLRELLGEEFCNLSIELLSNYSYKKVLERVETRDISALENFHKRMVQFFEDLWAIESCHKMSDFYEYFEQRLCMDKFKEKQYPSLFEIFYEILATLTNYEKNLVFDDYGKYFDSNVGKNLYQLLLRSLHEIYLPSAEIFTGEKLEIRDWENLRYEKHRESRAVFLDVDDKSLPRGKGRKSFFTETQKLQLGLRTQEDEILEEKYRFYQSLATEKEIVFLVQISEKENKSSSSFLEEWLWKQGKNIQKNPYSKEYFLSSLKKTFQTERNWKRKEEDFSFLKKEKEDFESRGNRLVLGAYDWDRIVSCEKYFYFSQCLEKKSLEEDLNFGISSKLLGNICHHVMENIAKLQWKDFLKTKKFSLTQEMFEKIFKEELLSQSLKIPFFLENYLEGILFPKLRKNIFYFLKEIEKKYSGTTLTRFQGEKKSWDEKEKEKPIYEGKFFNVYFEGRADLIIESKETFEIIDYKTGNTIQDQLNFYSYVFAPKNQNVEGSYYNLWEGKFTAAKERDENFVENVKDFFKEFEHKEVYNISQKKSACIYCPYTEICLREEEVCQD